MGAFLGRNRVSMAMIVGNSGAKLKTLLDATKSTYHLFYLYKGTTAEGLIGYDDTENVTDMRSMFYDCINLTTVPLFNTENVTNMNSMFYNCKALTTVPLFNTDNVTNMGTMFSSCSNLTGDFLFNIQTATNTSNMFYNCYQITKVTLLNHQNSTSVGSTFRYCQQLKTVKLSKVSNKITSSAYWFGNCLSLEVVDFSDAVSVPTLSNTNAFSGVPTTCKIVIPDSLYDTWTTATNWNALTQQFVKASEYTEA